MSCSDAPGGCGCPTGPGGAVVPPRSRPGLPALRYRLGTHSSFLARMLGRLPLESPPDGPGAGARPLAPLVRGGETDPAVALLDAWAMAADVLAFYQERIANEGFLRTATERRSVLELARAIAYELHPGVAASTWLAFTVDEPAGAHAKVRVGEGVKVLSTPGQDERPQTFETTGALELRSQWNAMRPRRRAPDPPRLGMRELCLEGVATRLAPGDAVLIVGDERQGDSGSERWDFRVVSKVTELAEENLTVVRVPALGTFAPFVRPAERNPRVYALRRRAALFGHNAPDWKVLPAQTRAAFLPAPSGAVTSETDPRLDPWKADFVTQWPGFGIPGRAQPQVDLDGVYDGIVPGSWIVLAHPGYSEAYQIDQVAIGSRTDYTLTGKVTHVTLDGDENLARFHENLRSTVAWVESEELRLAERPIPDAVEGAELALDDLIPHPAPGAVLIVRGESAGESGRAAEAVVVDRADDVDGRTVIRLAAPLARAYVRDTVEILGNVVPATHGETVRAEVLGSGDASAPNQSLALGRRPLTHLPAATATGAAPALEVRVEGVVWRRAPSLFELARDEEAYAVRIGGDGDARVVFGDGVRGARLPTGVENVRATYRVGMGPEGEVDADRLTLPADRPLGVRAVTNPLPADGAAAPESLAGARDNAPLTVLTLGRIVSLRDVEDFARGFGAVGKASATAVQSGEARYVHLTVAGEDGGQIQPVSATHANLVAALDAARDPLLHVRVGGYEEQRLLLEVGLTVDRRHQAQDVRTAVRAALLDAFGFARRDFAEPVTAASVMAAAHQVAGVVACRVTRLEAATPAGVRSESGGLLPAVVVDDRGGTVRHALLLLAAGDLVVEETP